MFITFWGFVLNSEKTSVLLEKLKSDFPLSNPLEILNSELLFEDLITFRKKFAKPKSWNIKFMRLDEDNIAFYIDETGVINKNKFGEIDKNFGITPDDNSKKVIKKFFKWVNSLFTETSEDEFLKIGNFFYIKE